MNEPSPLTHFSRTAEHVAGGVIHNYSTSFGFATQMLGRRHRAHIRNIYALVRVADEIVDGVAREAGLTFDEQVTVLERYAEETHRAMRTGYSSDLVVHAFATTARASAIDETLTTPFFASMRADLDGSQDAHSVTVFDQETHASYVFGSAEVVGLMCLRVFVRDQALTAAERSQLEFGARRLGAAFQNINFLRDLADDTERLGRSYLSTRARLTDADKDAWVVEVRGQLSDAQTVLPILPRDARAAVRSALAFFSALTNRVARTPIERLYVQRVRVPNPVKFGLAAGAVLTTMTEKRA